MPSIEKDADQQHPANPADGISSAAAPDCAHLEVFPETPRADAAGRVNMRKVFLQINTVEP